MPSAWLEANTPAPDLGEDVREPATEPGRVTHPFEITSVSGRIPGSFGEGGRVGGPSGSWQGSGAATAAAAAARGRYDKGNLMREVKAEGRGESGGIGRRLKGEGCLACVLLRPGVSCALRGSLSALLHLLLPRDPCELAEVENPETANTHDNYLASGELETLVQTCSVPQFGPVTRQRPPPQQKNASDVPT